MVASATETEETETETVAMVVDHATTIHGREATKAIATKRILEN